MSLFANQRLKNCKPIFLKFFKGDYNTLGNDRRTERKMILKEQKCCDMEEEQDKAN